MSLVTPCVCSDHATYRLTVHKKLQDISHCLHAIKFFFVISRFTHILNEQTNNFYEIKATFAFFLQRSCIHTPLPTPHSTSVPIHLTLHFCPHSYPIYTLQYTSPSADRHEQQIYDPANIYKHSIPNGLGMYGP